MSMPPRRTVALPDSGMFKRAGKIRLGITEQATSRAGQLFDRPKSIDWLEVHADESGITSPDAAAAFHEVYGDKPKSINVLLPGHTPDEVFEGAHRLYGTGKLKIRCDGETCDVRRATGGWDEKPCVCKANEIPPVILKNGQQQRNEKHCTLSWTLQVILAEVAGIGVWTVTTTSQIAADDITNALRLAHVMTGDLAMMRATLWMREVEVSPDGKTKKVYVPSLRFDSYTPAQLMAGEGRERITVGPRVELPSLPAPEDDVDDGEHPDADAESVDVEIQPAAAQPDESLLDAVKRQIRAGLPVEHGKYILEHYGATIGAASSAIVTLHGEDARNLGGLLEALIAAGAEDDGEPVADDDVEVLA